MLTATKPYGKKRALFGAVAQLGERVNGIHEVSGSIPLSSTIFLKKDRSQKGFSLFFSCLLLTAFFVSRGLFMLESPPW